MTNWYEGGELSRLDAIRIIDRATDHDDPYWDNVVEDWYDEETDSWPSLQHVFSALGVTEQEYVEATRCDNANWPNERSDDAVSVPRALLEELANDLEAELNHEHIDHPVTNRRLDVDMGVVRRARKVLGGGDAEATDE